MGEAKLKTNKKSYDETKEAERLDKFYARRITIAKNGYIAFKEKKFTSAIQNFTEYLTILAKVNGKSDIYSLTPAMFDNKKETAEIFFIAQIYWHISMIYEKMPTMEPYFMKAISQYEKFTINQPFQILNTEQIRKYLNNSGKLSRYRGHLRKTYSRIYLKSKKCFIATHTFGDTHPVTMELREFKKFLLKLPLGEALVRSYYLISSPLVDYLDMRPKTSKYFKLIMSPLLFTFSKLVKPFRI